MIKTKTQSSNDMADTEQEWEVFSSWAAVKGMLDSPDGWHGTIAYWYKGLPSYASENSEEVTCIDCSGVGTVENGTKVCRSCRRLGYRLHEVRTAILYCLFGMPEPPEGWERLGSYGSSGESECWRCGDGTGNEEQRKSCLLCEGDGLIYLGSGWHKVVMRRLKPR